MIRFIIDQIISIAAMLAPLSIVIAATSLLFNFRQSRAKRSFDASSDLRKNLNTLGIKSYLLNWSMIGGSAVSAAVLQIREAIEGRLGKNPSVDEVNKFTSEKILFESVAEKAWRDSKVIDKFQSEAQDFGRLQAELGIRLPLIQAAINTVETRLRMLFLLNIFTLSSFRNDVRYRTLCRDTPAGETPNPMKELQTLILSAVQIPGKLPFSQACKLLESFSKVASRVDDRKILRLFSRQSYVRRLTIWLTELRAHDKNPAQLNSVLDSLKSNTAAEYRLLEIAAIKIFQGSQKTFVELSELRRSAELLLGELKGETGSEDLESSTSDFLKKYSEEKTEDFNSFLALLRIRSKGIDDPDIDLFLASTSGVIELAESALTRGGRVNTTLGEIQMKYPSEFKDASEGGEIEPS